MIYDIQTSFVKFIKGIEDLDVFSYADNSINIGQSYLCKTKVNLNGTETTFDIQYEFSSSIYIDFIRDEKDYLLFRYIKRTKKEDGSEQYIKIIDYDNTVGTITIEEPIGEEVLTTDTFNIIILDSIYIYANSPITLGGQRNFSKERISINMNLQTKRDSSREKILTFISLIKNTINRDDGVPLYVDDILIAYAKPTRSTNFNQTVNSGTQFIEYFGSCNLEYYIET